MHSGPDEIERDIPCPRRRVQGLKLARGGTTPNVRDVAITGLSITLSECFVQQCCRLSTFPFSERTRYLIGWIGGCLARPGTGGLVLATYVVAIRRKARLETVTAEERVR